MSGPREEATQVAGATGEWDVNLFFQYRAATGERKRLIGSRIILDNTPLIKLLLTQLTRKFRARPGQRLPPAAKMGGCQGFDKIPWDDAMQAGRIALLKAMESYDPVKSKGRIGFYLAMKFRYELQRLVLSEHLVKVGRGYEKFRPDIELSDDSEALDRWSGGYCDPVCLPEGVTSEDIEGWEESGKWPDAPPELPSPPQPPPELPRTPGWVRFLSRCTFTPNGRAVLSDAYYAYRLDCREEGVTGVSRPVFVAELKPHGVTEKFVRAHKSRPSRGLAGIRIRLQFA